MKTIALQVGFDWADKKHDFALFDPLTQKKETGVIAHDPTKFNNWMESLRKRFPEGQFEVSVELTRGPLINLLKQFDFIDIYPVNPVSSKRFRQTFYPSLKKDDPLDADLILELLVKHKDHLRKLISGNKEVIKVEALCSNRRKLVQRKTKSIQALIATLKEYYPLAIEVAAEELDSILALNFLKKWPDLESLTKARATTVRKFYYANQCRSENRINARLKLIEEATPLTEDQSVIIPSRLYMLSLVGQIESLKQSILEHDRLIRELYTEHDSRAIFDSLPGAGEVIAPRLLVAFDLSFGDIDSPQRMAAFSGVAPVRSASGNSCKIMRRIWRPLFLHQTFIEHARCSLIKSKWAQAYYTALRDQGQKHWAIIRKIAYKWIRIISKCYVDNELYDEEKYIKTLKRRKAWVAKYL
jgi:hypothetical protein